MSSTQHAVLCSFGFITLAVIHMVVVWYIGMPSFFKKQKIWEERKGKDYCGTCFGNLPDSCDCVLTDRPTTSRQLFTETEKKDENKKNN
jgi:hypothetical protein